MSRPFTYGLADFDRKTGSIGSYVHLPVEGAEGRNLPEFLKSAAAHDWELCATLPGPSIKGSRIADRTQKRGGRVGEDYNEITTLVFKRVPRTFDQFIERHRLFLYLVQNIVLANAINLASSPERAEKYRHVISATGIQGVIWEALDAASCVPDGVDVRNAATEFCAYMLPNLREVEERAKGKPMQVPGWFGRPGARQG